MPPKTTTAPRARQTRLPFARCSAHTVYPKEDVVQSHIEGALTQKGYTVLSTSEHRKKEKCPHCDRWMTSKVGRGCSKGVPDLLVRNPRWTPTMWMGIEVKGAKTPLSPEQKLLREQKAICIARSVDEALSLVQKFENALLKIQ